MATTIKDIKDFFGYATLTEFSTDWKAMSDRDKEQIRGGIEDGSFDYAL